MTKQIEEEARKLCTFENLDQAFLYAKEHPVEMQLFVKFLIRCMNFKMKNKNYPVRNGIFLFSFIVDNIFVLAYNINVISI